MPADDELTKRYALDSTPLAHGGMAEIWAARDRRLGRQVVIKLIKAAADDLNADLPRRFIREARLTALLDHPGIPAVYDADLEGTQLYLVLQRISGIDLDDLIEESSPLPLAWVAIIGAQVACILDAIHRAGIIHRDIKPGNLMLDTSGAVKVLDFGIATALGRQDLSRITRTGESIGTLSYMAPEQVNGEPVTRQSDLYGLGATLYDLLTGEPPFPGPGTRAILGQQLHSDVVRPRELREDIPQGLEDLILAMLEKEPANRPADAAETYGALLPFTADTPHSGSAEAAGFDSTRAYLALCGRIPAHVAAPAPSAATSAVDRVVLAQARTDADRLRNAGKLEGAAQIVGAVIMPAVDRYGATDTEVIQLRELYCDLLELTEQWHRAAQEHQFLARDMVIGMRDEPGFALDRAIEHRLQAIRAHIRLGEKARARTQLMKLLEELKQIHGPEHPAVAAIRKELEELDSQS